MDLYSAQCTSGGGDAGCTCSEVSTGTRCQTSLCSDAHGSTIVRSANATGGWACRCDVSGVWGGTFCNVSQCGPGKPQLADGGWRCQCPDAYDPTDALCSGKCAANAELGTDGKCRCKFPFTGRYCDIDQCAWDSSVNRYTAITGGHQPGSDVCSCFNNYWVGKFCNISRCGALGTPVPFKGALDMRVFSCTCMDKVAVKDTNQLNVPGGFICKHVTGCVGGTYNPEDGGCSCGLTDPYCASLLSSASLGTPTTVPTVAPTVAPTASVGTPTGSPTRTPTSAPTTRAPTRAPTRSPTSVPTAAPTTATPTAGTDDGKVSCFVCPTDATRCCDATTGAVVPGTPGSTPTIPGGNLNLPTVPAPTPIPSAGERSHAVQWTLAILPLLLALFFAADGNE